ncbi:MAG: EAL domain-containing protein [Magnetovibrionaceae bacterium]
MPEAQFIQRSQAADLVMKLRGWSGSATSGFNTMILLSFSVVPVNEAEDGFWADLNRLLLAQRSRFNAQLFELNHVDKALLLQMTEFNQVRILSDMRVDVLRLIQQYFPNHFGQIDQSRLLRRVDLKTKLEAAITLLEKLQRFEQKKPSDEPAVKLRPLADQDIEKVDAVNKQIGPEAFNKAFVRGQEVAVIRPPLPIYSVMTEYFVSMEMLKNHLFADVELRGMGNRFAQLTITLDRALLGGFNNLNPQGVPCSVNVNVETIFTRTFEEFLKTTPKSSLENILFEFRQGNILQHFDEFRVASELLRARGCTIAVDAVFPESVGLLNMDRLECKMVKIFWRQGAETVLPERAKDIKRILDAGIDVVLARIDDSQAVTMGHRLGINMFQGFHIDDRLQKEGG